MNWPSGCLTCRLIIRVLAFAVIGCCWPEGWAIVQSRDTSVALSYGNHVFTPGLFVRGCIHNLCSWTVSAELSKGLMPVQHQSIAVERSEKSRHMKPCECEYLFGILGCKFTYLFWEQKTAQIDWCFQVVLLCVCCPRRCEVQSSSCEALWWQGEKNQWFPNW